MGKHKKRNTKHSDLCRKVSSDEKCLASKSKQRKAAKVETQG